MPLMAANRENFKGKRVLDIGTGSGILSLHAAKLGASKVVATDIETAAIDCTRENARRLGVDSIVETRLVSLEDPSAYSVIRPGETFDIVLAFPYCGVNREPSLGVGAPGNGITQNDNIRFGLSIIRGLRDHLNEGGVLILCYRFAVMHSFAVGYARSLGYSVEHHAAPQVPPYDWYVLFNTFAAEVARTENIEPAALLLPRPRGGSSEPSDPMPGRPGGPGGPWGRGGPDGRGGPGGPPGVGGPGTFGPGGFAPGPGGMGGPGGELLVRVDHGERPAGPPQLWDHKLDRILPGVIVIRRKATSAGPTGPEPAGRQELRQPGGHGPGR